MSGAFGWAPKPATRTSDPTPAASGFADAKRAYQAPQPSSRRAPIDPPPPPRVLPTAAPKPSALPGATHALKSTARNVLVVVLDITPSMRKWPEEIYKRLPLLYREAAKYLGGEDLEILFIAHADARNDPHPVQVTRFGAGPELDAHLASLGRVGDGGGQGTESQELVAAYLCERVDLASAQNAYVFFVTDEMACGKIDPGLAEAVLGFRPAELDTRAAFRRLARKANAYAVFCGTDAEEPYRREDPRYNPEKIRAGWEGLVGAERVLPLEDARRVVDVMLGCLATETGQLDVFTADLTARQGNGRYAKQNVASVLASVALVGQGSLPKLPAGPGTRPLLPPGPKT